MNVALLSSFRDATGYLPRYAEQVRELATALGAQGDALHCVWCEGDSVDDSHAALLDLALHDPTPYTVDIFQHTHGGPHFGSVEHPQRFAQLAGVGNALLDHVPDDADSVLIVESDLVWEAATLVRLVGHLATVPAVAPMVMDSDPADRFYDVFAFRRGGERFTNAAPYHPDLATVRPGELLQLESAGSVVAMRGHLARRARFPREDVIVGFCRELCADGATLYLDPRLCVRHP